MAKTNTSTGIRVRFAPDREIPIEATTARMLRTQNAEQADALIDQIHSAWDGLDLSSFTEANTTRSEGTGEGTGEEMIPEEIREKIGAIFWMLGEARERLSDLLFLTEDARLFEGVGGYGARSRVPTAAGHDY